MLKRLDYIGHVGETSFSDPLLIGKIIIAVYKDGVGASKLLKNIPPVDKQASYKSPTGTISFSQAIQPGEPVIVLYRDGVLESTCIEILYQPDVVLPNAEAGFDYHASFFADGSTPLEITDKVKPSWMEIDLDGNLITLSGHPTLADEATGLDISFTLTNACSSVGFARTIDVVILERTLTFRLGAPHSLSPEFVAAFDSPVDADLMVNTIFADGYVATDCTLPAAESMTANNFPIPAGGFAGSKVGTPGTGWTMLKSYSIYGVFITVTGGYAGAVADGDVIMMGNYSVTINFDGC